MKAFLLCHSNSLDAVLSALRVPTGNTVTVEERDYNAQTNTWGAPYDVQVAEFTGGYATVGKLGQFTALLVQSTVAALNAIDASVPANDLIVLCRVSEGEVKWSELSGNIPAAARTKINTFLTSRGLQTIPAGTALRVVVRQVFRAFENGFEPDGSTDLGAA